MMSLLLFVFLLQLVIQIINTLGKQHINDLVSDSLSYQHKHVATAYLC